MAQVPVTINGRGYQIACDDGQEDHLRRLAGLVDRRVAELAAAMGQVGDQRLLVMASLLVADELSETTTALEEAERRLGERDKAASGAEAGASAALDRAARRLGEIAARLERT